ncbi:acyl-ACP--UDP-N-acetylglucosamine O-acyltransferase [Desulfuromonas sp. CSMB_57]|jgi:UDP-N-acetylglucosamine acyltransferase|uniref:acyl-ACP--UDP-N-acetylglucosamine O-acyltransferase n=1 Tax=Desulfuromonas sp. CSMB_57 TaxID=2807629 RepID=UPI001CD818AA|nr:acyl-ACP--UDP-N-acetylglucosamine O-acyltransferase [Desulfuromonas sp. CSMB_57]
MPRIHPSAFVDPSAILADQVEIGPNVFIDAEVTIGDGTRIMHGAHIGRWTTLGSGNTVYPYAVVGQDPQDVGYHGEQAFTVIGDGNIIREGVTIHRGNREGTSTVIGHGNYFMVNSHVAHNCRIGNHVILVNGCLLAGHVDVDDRAIISGNCQIHQFVRIGTLAMMRGGSSATKDVPPFCVNDRMSCLRAVNVVGLRRNGYDPQRIRAIKNAFKTLFLSGLRLEAALQELETRADADDDVRLLVDFIRASKRGVGSGRKSGQSGE